MIRKPSKQDGFTLIELLVVVVIIGILASVAVPNFMGAQDKAKNSGVQANGHNVQMALEQYGVDNASVYPTNLSSVISATSAYLTAYPRTPWNTLQTASINAVAADVALGQGTVTSYGAGDTGSGTPKAPTTTAHYGAVAYLVGGSASEQYNLSGSGKQGSNAICVFKVRNY